MVMSFHRTSARFWLPIGVGLPQWRCAFASVGQHAPLFACGASSPRTAHRRTVRRSPLASPIGCSMERDPLDTQSPRIVVNSAKSIRMSCVESRTPQGGMGSCVGSSRSRNPRAAWRRAGGALVGVQGRHWRAAHMCFHYSHNAFLSTTHGSQLLRIAPLEPWPVRTEVEACTELTCETDRSLPLVGQTSDLGRDVATTRLHPSQSKPSVSDGRCRFRLTTFRRWK